MIDAANGYRIAGLTVVGVGNVRTSNVVGVRDGYVEVAEISTFSSRHLEAKLVLHFQRAEDVSDNVAAVSSQSRNGTFDDKIFCFQTVSILQFERRYSKSCIRDDKFLLERLAGSNDLVTFSTALPSPSVKAPLKPLASILPSAVTTTPFEAVAV